MTLADDLGSAAAQAGARGDVANAGAITWTVAGRAFATLDPGAGSAAFRLDPVLAAAARRTPDTKGSDRGPEWIEFAPRDYDGHASDRAIAWFAAAARRAAAG
ncbi:MAG: hypothetical protein OEX05_10505 [Chloroflexota bacterium]|nr:hypothetical protein [Chloroflexota bacterium]